MNTVLRNTKSAAIIFTQYAVVAVVFIHLFIWKKELKKYLLSTIHEFVGICQLILLGCWLVEKYRKKT